MKMRVYFEAGVIGCAEVDRKARTGVWRVLYNLLTRLLDCDHIDLIAFVSNEAHFDYLIQAVSNDANLSSLKIIKTFDNEIGLPKSIAIFPWFLPSEDLQKKFKHTITYTYDVIPIMNPEWFDDQTVKNNMIYYFSNFSSGNHLVTISNTTKRDLLNLFPNLQSENISVIYPGIDSNQFSVSHRKYACKSSFLNCKPYALVVGTIEPRKNISFAIKSFLEYKTRNPASNLQLVVIGGSGWGTSIKNDNYNGQNSIQFLGYVSDVELSKIYSNATMFLFPSLYEGFGFPPLEAMSHGVPVLSSSAPCMPEILNDSCLYFDPRDENSLASRIQELYDNPHLRHVLSRNGRSFCLKYNWENYLETFNSMLYNIQ